MFQTLEVQAPGWCAASRAQRWEISGGGWVMQNCWWAGLEESLPSTREALGSLSSTAQSQQSGTRL